MSKQPDFKDLQQLAAEILGVNADDVQLEKSFAKDLAADSLDLVELVAAIEDKYDVELSDERLESMKVIGDLWTFLEEEQSKKKQEV
jgi:acyl carrier protein